LKQQNKTEHAFIILTKSIPQLAHGPNIKIAWKRQTKYMYNVIMK